MKQRYSLPGLSSAQEYQKCPLRSCETQISTSGHTARQKHLISTLCYRFRMKDINLLIVSNSSTFQGSRELELNSEKQCICLKISMVFWAARHTDLLFPLFTNTCQLPSTFSYLCNATAREPSLPSAGYMHIQRAPDTVVLHKSITVQVHRKQKSRWLLSQEWHRLIHLKLH